MNRRLKIELYTPTIVCVVPVKLNAERSEVAPPVTADNILLLIKIQMNKTRSLLQPDIEIFTRIFRRVSFLGIALLALALTGCSFLRLHSSPPKAHVNSMQLTNLTTGPVTFPVLQAQVMRFADTYAATVAQA